MLIKETECEDPEEMPHSELYFLRVCTIWEGNNIFEKDKYDRFLKSITRYPLIYTMDHFDLIVSNFIEKSIDLQRV